MWVIKKSGKEKYKFKKQLMRTMERFLFWAFLTVKSLCFSGQRAVQHSLFSCTGISWRCNHSTASYRRWCNTLTMLCSLLMRDWWDARASVFLCAWALQVNDITNVRMMRLCRTTIREQELEVSVCIRVSLVTFQWKNWKELCYRHGMSTGRVHCQYNV